MKSWANVVNNSPCLSKHDFHVSMVNGSESVMVPDEILDDDPLWEDFLVGRFLLTAPHVAKNHVVNKIWLLGDKSVKVDVFVVNTKMVKFQI